MVMQYNYDNMNKLMSHITDQNVENYRPGDMNFDLYNCITKPSERKLMI